MDLLYPLVCALIDRDSTSSSVRDALAAHLGASHKKVNKMLSEMVDKGMLLRVQTAQQQYYSYDWRKPYKGQ